MSRPMSESIDADARDTERFVYHETSLRRFALAIARPVFRPFMELQVGGLENVPAEGACILASNHLSNWDVFPMQFAMPRTIFFMGKAELFQIKPVSALLRDFGAFPVYRGEKDAWAMRHAIGVLEAGLVLGMFPEGHRSSGKGLLPGKIGTARLAMETHCAIVPMVITGTEHFMASFPRRRHVRASFLASIHGEPSETPEALTERLMLALAAALPEELRGVYAGRSASESAA